MTVNYYGNTNSMARKSNEKLWNHLINELDDFQVQAGWFEESRYDSDTPIAYVAAIQNFGARVRTADSFKKYLHVIGIHLRKDKTEFIIPPRPFMDNAKRRVESDEGKQIILQELLKVFAGKQTMEKALNRMGLWLQGVIQEEIKAINSPKLSGMTVEMRDMSYTSESANKSTKPLNSTGLMFSSVQYKAEKKQ